jgi:hypothetical protein
MKNGVEILERVKAERDRICEDGGDTAQKIESGLYLEGDDARRFEGYMADPKQEMTRWIRIHGEEPVRPIR